MEDDLFFDTRDEVTSVPDVGSEDCCSSGMKNSALEYEFWTRKLESVDERRSRFVKWMNLSSDWGVNTDEDGLGDRSFGETKISSDRLRDNGDTVLANLDSNDQFFSSRSLSTGFSNDALESEEDGSLGENFSWKIRNLDDGTEFIVDELGQDGMLRRLREVGSNRAISFEEFQRNLGSSPMVQRFLRREYEDCNAVDVKKEVKRGWLSKLRGVTCNGDKTRVQGKPGTIGSKTGAGTCRVRVQSLRKQSKQLSSLYNGQDFPAHEGSILTMKFSPDGQYLASAGNDGIVRVWKVIEAEISDKFSHQDVDHSSVYFLRNDFTKLATLNVDKEKIVPIKSLRKTTESACVILPSKVFRLLEKPVHEYHGHKGEVLALSWSKNGYLLSSSVDNTARLWQVGSGKCLGVYKHNNYVTCIEFNPADDNYFISGSIDGKVRIWEVHRCRVIDWTDIREIVTAVCFCPDGKGGIVGSMDGNCRFYDITDNRLELGAQISLPGKKLTGKRITGFEFCPSDANKVLVTSADSQVRILSGSNIICKFKGVRHSGSQAPASFTPDGKHIVAATEDSNVYIWNYINQDRTCSKAKTIRSCESFSSHNASIAIPWCGLKTDTGTGTGIVPESILENEDCDDNLLKISSSSFPDCFSLSRGLFLDSLYKGTSTWPAEKLPDSPSAAVSPSIYRSEFKFLKSALQSAFANPHMWGNVIVTAGWDGCIRTFLNYGLPIRF